MEEDKENKYPEKSKMAKQSVVDRFNTTSAQPLDFQVYCTYPPRTIHQILAGLQRYMLQKNVDAPKIIDRKDSRFRENVYRALRQKGVGTDVRHTSTSQKRRRTDFGIVM